MSVAGQDLAWAFGYGSLMWQPGFPVDVRDTATLEGWHRALCVYSWHYRGTRERPGLVMGLAPGGACVGRALGFARHREAEVLDYLDRREQTHYVYERRLVQIRRASGETVAAWAYIARTDHPQYAGDLPDEAVLRLVLQGAGIGGACVDYVRQTLAHLRGMGIEEPRLEALARRLAAAS
jgi:cation transport protein ChaC